jgi:hypothetical protein
MRQQYLNISSVNISDRVEEVNIGFFEIVLQRDWGGDAARMCSVTGNMIIQNLGVVYEEEPFSEPVRVMQQSL